LAEGKSTLGLASLVDSPDGAGRAWGVVGTLTGACGGVGGGACGGTTLGSDGSALGLGLGSNGAGASVTDDTTDRTALAASPESEAEAEGAPTADATKTAPTSKIRQHKYGLGADIVSLDRQAAMFLQMFGFKH
jgi:hypothetical protein